MLLHTESGKSSTEHAERCLQVPVPSQHPHFAERGHCVSLRFCCVLFCFALGWDRFNLKNIHTGLIVGGGGSDWIPVLQLMTRNAGN